jgi:hypothetical protein
MLKSKMNLVIPNRRSLPLRNLLSAGKQQSRFLASLGITTKN